ncbi:hypothetical protein SODG_000335 [Sodalis praecaptivus]
MDAGNFPLQGAAGHRIERAERLVHQQHLRVGGQRARHADPLLLAAGELVWIAVTKLLRIEMQQRQQFAHALVNALTRPFQQLRHGGDILLHDPVGK